RCRRFGGGAGRSGARVLGTGCAARPAAGPRRGRCRAGRRRCGGVGGRPFEWVVAGRDREGEVSETGCWHGNGATRKTFDYREETLRGHGRITATGQGAAERYC